MTDNQIDVWGVMVPRPDGLTHMEEGYLFGHYDSRGGATFIPAASAKEALEDYAAIFCPTLPEDEIMAFNTAVAELLFNEPVTAMFFGAMPDIGELDIDYKGSFHIGQLWHRVRGRSVAGTEFPATAWRGMPIMVCWTETLPEFCGEMYEYEVRPWALGEDAYGVMYGTGLE